MRAAHNIILLAATLSVSATYAADPRYVAGGGRQGSYWEAFLISDTPAGVGAVREIKVAFITNEGRATNIEFLANCNPGYPHVVDQDDRKIDISINARPSQADLLPYGVWHASCRKQFGRFSERGADGRRHLSTGKFSFMDNGVKQVAEVKPSAHLTPMKGLIQLSIGAAAQSEIVTVYCSPSVPTVFWPATKSKVEISDAEEERTRKGEPLVRRALSIWEAVCSPIPTQSGARVASIDASVTAKSPVGNPASTSVDRDVAAGKPASKAPSQTSNGGPSAASASKDEISAIKTMYQAYMFRSKICDIVKEYSDDAGPLRDVMSQVDKSSKERGLDTEKIWSEAAATLYEAQFGPQLKMIESLEAMGGFSLPSDRRKAAPQCAQLTSFVKSNANALLQLQNGAGKPQIKKDF